MSGKASKAMPGSLWRLGPAKLTGETRIDHTGSTRMLRPPVWISQLAWPTNDNRTLLPSTRGGGVSACAFCTQSGQVARLGGLGDRKSTRLNSSHQIISYAVFCLKKKKYKYTR